MCAEMEEPKPPERKFKAMATELREQRARLAELEAEVSRLRSFNVAHDRKSTGLEELYDRVDWLSPEILLTPTSSLGDSQKRLNQCEGDTAGSKAPARRAKSVPVPRHYAGELGDFACVVATAVEQLQQRIGAAEWKRTPKVCVPQNISDPVQDVASAVAMACAKIKQENQCGGELKPGGRQEEEESKEEGQAISDGIGGSFTSADVSTAGSSAVASVSASASTAAPVATATPHRFDGSASSSTSQAGSDLASWTPRCRREDLHLDGSSPSLGPSSHISSQRHARFTPVGPLPRARKMTGCRMAATSRAGSIVRTRTPSEVTPVVECSSSFVHGHVLVPSKFVPAVVPMNQFFRYGCPKLASSWLLSDLTETTVFVPASHAQSFAQIDDMARPVIAAPLLRSKSPWASSLSTPRTIVAKRALASHRCM